MNFNTENYEFPPDGFKMEVHIITPEIAKDWLLNHNTHNRNEKPTSIDMYSNDMSARSWMFTGESIKFDYNGVLLDGQNRLKACIRSGESFCSVVMWGLAPESQKVMDQVVKRSFGDNLKLDGETNSVIIASSIGVITSILCGFKRNISSISISERERILSDNPGIRKSASRASSIRDYPELKGLLSPAQISSLHYLFTVAGENLGYPESAEVFFDSLSLKSTKHLDEGSPFLAVRKWIKTHTKNASTITPKDRMAVMLKTWEMWMRGRSVTVMRWTSGGPQAEEFPWVYGLPTDFQSS